MLHNDCLPRGLFAVSRSRRELSSLVFGRDALALTRSLEFEEGIQEREYAVTSLLIATPPRGPRSRTNWCSNLPEHVQVELATDASDGVGERLETAWVPKNSLKLALRGRTGRVLFPTSPHPLEPVLVVTGRRRIFEHRSGWRVSLDAALAFHEFDPTGSLSLQASAAVTPPFAQEDGTVVTLEDVRDTDVLAGAAAPPGIPGWLLELHGSLPPFDVLRRGLVLLSAREATARPLATRLLSLSPPASASLCAA
jgi:hypothetical protein